MIVVVLLMMGLMFGLGYFYGQLGAIREEIEWLEAHIKECHASSDR